MDARCFPWTDQGFRGHARRELVLYELHVATFTPSGTFEAVMAHLPPLAASL